LSLLLLLLLKLVVPGRGNQSEHNIIHINFIRKGDWKDALYERGALIVREIKEL
jgi:hypothetical protein